MDKWLWHARFFKTRSLAARIVAERRVRVNSEPVAKPSIAVGTGDVLTFAQGRVIRVIRILATGTRRGPAVEAQSLYEDLSPEAASDTPILAARTGPRPTKKDRRKLDDLRPQTNAKG